MNPLLTINKVAEFSEECIKIFDFETGVKTINDFCHRVETLSEKYLDSYYASDKINKFKGDVTEILAEIFFNMYAAEPRVGLFNYTPIDSTDDYGVDGTGTNVNNDFSVAQVKFRSDPTSKITWEDMAKTFAKGIISYPQLSREKDKVVFLFTTTYDVTGPCKINLRDRLVLIDRYIIAGYIDNNFNFWKEAEERIGATLDSLNAQT
jgi:hypothetical protein